jgi:hypothetical protein
MAVTVKAVQDTAAQLEKTFRRAAAQGGNPTELTRTEVRRTPMSAMERTYLLNQIDGFSRNSGVSLAENTFKQLNGIALESVLKANTDRSKNSISTTEVANATLRGQELWHIAAKKP